jgi:hypothetical protein
MGVKRSRIHSCSRRIDKSMAMQKWNWLECRTEQDIALKRKRYIAMYHSETADTKHSTSNKRDFIKCKAPKESRLDAAHNCLDKLKFLHFSSTTHRPAELCGASLGNYV